MKLLFADPNRDLLKAYTDLLALDGHEVTVCFEGTEALRLIAGTRFDVAVINASLPRVSCGRLVELLREREILSVVLTDRKPSARLLLEPAPPNAYLPFPFLPSEMISLLEALTQKRASGRSFPAADLRISVSGFRIENTDVRLTNSEIDLLETLSAGVPVKYKNADVLVSALNQKLAAAGSAASIVYRIKEGFSLVTDHEKG